MQYLSCALVRGRGIVFLRYYQGIAKSAGKNFRDGEKVTSTRARKQALVAMVLLYHSSDRGWFWVLARFVLRGFCSVVQYSVVKA